MVFDCGDASPDEVDVFGEGPAFYDGLLLVKRSQRHLAFHIELFEDAVGDTVEDVVVPDALQKVFRALCNCYLIPSVEREAIMLLPYDQFYPSKSDTPVNPTAPSSDTSPEYLNSNNFTFRILEQIKRRLLSLYLLGNFREARIQIALQKLLSPLLITQALIIDLPHHRFLCGKLLRFLPDSLHAFDVAAYDVVAVGHVVEEVVSGVTAHARVAAKDEQEFYVGLADLGFYPLPAVHLLRLAVQVPVHGLDQDHSGLGRGVVGFQELPELSLQCFQELAAQFNKCLCLLLTGKIRVSIGC